MPKNCSNGSIAVVCAADVATLNPSVDTTNNRLSGYTFDAAGNTTKDAASKRFTYDGENKQTKVETVDSNNNPITTIGEYFYDGDGKRVKKIVGNEVTIFVYDAAGKLVAEYSNQISPTPQVSYLTADNLGTPRINTDANGNVIARHDYLPFGEEAFTAQRTQGLNYSNDTVRQGFTGYQKDSETDLEFAEARMYANKLGRFIATDPLLSSGKIENPQTWNRYTYVLNNPLGFTDPTGMYVWDKSLGGKTADGEVSFDIRLRRKNFRQGLERAKENSEKVKSIYGEKSTEYLNAKKAVESYGKEGDKGVTIKAVADSKQDTAGFTSGIKGNVVVSFQNSFLSESNGIGENKDIPSDTQDLIGHEGYHVSNNNAGKVLDEYTSEFNAYTVQSVLDQAQRPSADAFITLKSGDKAYLWTSTWKTVDIDTNRKQAIKAIIKDYYPNAKPPVEKKKP